MTMSMREVREEGGRGAAARLFSALVWTDGPGPVLHAFHASFSPSREAFLARVGLRFGEVAVPHATVREGVDTDSPKVLALVASEILATLVAASAGTGSERLLSLDVTVARRFGGAA